jgi:hypothetical protein
VAAQQCAMTLVAEVARRFIIADIIGHPLSYFDLKPNIPVLTIKGGADDPLLARFAGRGIMDTTPSNDLSLAQRCTTSSLAYRETERA